MQLSKSSTSNTGSSWQQELKTALKTQAQLSEFFNIPIPSLEYSNFLPKSFAHKIKAAGINSSLWKQFIPSELERANTGLTDPIGDKKHSKGNGIIHRYHNRILFTPTTNCPVICRYCFRKNELSSKDQIYNARLNSLKEYLINHPEVNEVILTGGDPLILNEQKLANIFELLSEQNISFVRIHTRTPIILPSRINENFIELLKKYIPSFTQMILVLHCNHVDEIDQKVYRALNRLRDIPIKKLTQSVLLKGVNDSSKDLEQLFLKLVECDFIPYYLHHPDRARGAMHFTLSQEEGFKIYQKLRQNLPGWMIPHYVIDNSDGSGKKLVSST